MGMGHQKMGVGNIFLIEPMAQHAQARARVQNHPLTAARDLNTAGITAIHDIFGGWTGDTAPDTPKFYFKRHLKPQYTGSFMVRLEAMPDTHHPTQFIEA